MALAPQTRTLCPARVLIVDDLGSMRTLVRLVCEREGFEVVGEAADGPSALVLVLEHSPDIVILDYRMPGMNGQETAEAIRRLAPGPRILAFTASYDKMPTWADEFVPKEQLASIPAMVRALTPAA